MLAALFGFQEALDAAEVATGGGFLNWRAPRPRRVLVVDGEMPVADLRSRLQAIAAGSSVAAAPGMLQVLAGDLMDDGIGNLADPAVQRKLERCLDGVELVILDNLASLVAGAHENDPTPGCRSSGGCCGCAGAASR